jgi:hypothetical protein
VALGIVLIALAVPLAIGSVLAWTGRWRSWTGDLILGPLPAPITMMPALALFLLAIGLNQAGALSSGSPVGGLAVLAVIAGIVLYLWHPPWWGPRWYREAERPFAPNLKDPLTATALATSGPAPPREPLPAQFRGRPLDSWRGNLVERDEKGMRHGLARKGKIEGRLNLYEAGVTFVAEGLATRLEGAHDPIVVPADDVLDVRVVAAGAGPDGEKRRGTGLRSLFKRLVIDTPDGPLLFEVQRAADVRSEIRERL